MPDMGFPVRKICKEGSRKHEKRTGFWNLSAARFFACAASGTCQEYEKLTDHTTNRAD